MRCRHASISPLLPPEELTNIAVYKANTSTNLTLENKYPAWSDIYCSNVVSQLETVTMTASSPPLRTALIGLSSSAATSWASVAHLPALLSEKGRTKFAIKALLNSSTDAAKSAIKTYQLAANTKAYGSPEDLAADPDIDLVICNTRVDKHYETIIPSLRAGKDVFVEWPIAAKKEHIDEIVETAKQSGSRVAVGLQRRWNPIVSKVRELLNGNDAKLGKLLSVEARQYGATNDREILPPGLKYFTQKEIGGNVIVIGVGHGRTI